MISKAAMEAEWSVWEKEVKELEPHSPERRKTLSKITELWAELAAISQRLDTGPVIKDPAQRYFGLDPLKISALNIAQNIEADEFNLLTLYFQYTHNLILSNILRMRINPDAGTRLQNFFTPAEVTGFAKAKLQMEYDEQELWHERNRIQMEIGELRDSYGLFLFAESSYEAARSFGSPNADAHQQRSSWNAFSQLLTEVAVQIHEEKHPDLLKKTRRIDAHRESIYESCAQLLAKKAEGKDAKKIHRQLRQNMQELKKLETEIESTLAKLSIPGIGDSTSLVVKKNPDQATTFQPVKISQSTGDKT